MTCIILIKEVILTTGLFVKESIALGVILNSVNPLLYPDS